METRWLYVTSEELPRLREASRDVCVIPMGCVEKHGLHGPLGTDIIIANTICCEATKLETATVFPDFTFGDLPGTGPNVPCGTITIPLELQMQLLEALLEQIGRWGYKKILIYNGHGGNTVWLKAFLRNLSNKKRSYVTAVYNNNSAWTIEKLAADLRRGGPGSVPELTKEDEELVNKFRGEGNNLLIGHAGLGETGLVMGVAPESVKLDRLGIESGLPRNLTKKYSDANITIRDGGWGINYPNAFQGVDPVGCTQSLGKAMIRVEAEHFANAIKVLKEDEDLLRWQEETQGGW